MYSKFKETLKWKKRKYQKKILLSIKKTKFKRIKRKFIKSARKIKESDINSKEIKRLLDFDLEGNKINCFKKNSLQKK